MENGGCNYSLCIEGGMSLNNAERYCTHFTTDISSELPSGIIQDLFLDMISITSISFLCPSFPHTLLLHQGSTLVVPQQVQPAPANCAQLPHTLELYGQELIFITFRTIVFNPPL